MSSMTEIIRCVGCRGEITGKLMCGVTFCISVLFFRWGLVMLHHSSVGMRVCAHVGIWNWNIASVWATP